MPMFASPIETYSALPARLDLPIVQGDPVLLNMGLVFGPSNTVIGPDDSTVNLNGADVSMTVRRLPQGEVEAVAEYVPDDPANGIWALYIEPRVTEQMEGSYLYDVQVEGWYTILSGTLFVQRQYTKGKEKIK